MPGIVTDITEIATALGTLAADLPSALLSRPTELHNVPDEVWDRLVAAYHEGNHEQSFRTAFSNGMAFLAAEDGLRGRRPQRVEWKGAHRPPGDDIIPADLRIDHAYLISCKYFSKILLNAGPTRLFDRLLVGDERATENWFMVTAPQEFQRFYQAARVVAGAQGLPEQYQRLTAGQQNVLHRALSDRRLPVYLQPLWSALCGQVSRVSADRWQAALTTPKAKLRLLWRLLRITTATYFVLGTDRAAHIRIRVMSAWDWNQAFELRALTVVPRIAGQAEVAWNAVIRERSTQTERTVSGHVEVRWSHGRFVGTPEAKVYLDTPHMAVPGYELLR